MSAPDAAPLPRTGEVFFDVRGSSRSMRLSWYSDTGVAVFSIWQGGMCTATFRLAIDDLPRMIDMLGRGPRGPAQPGTAGPGGQVPDGTRADPVARTLPPYPPGPAGHGYPPEPAVDDYTYEPATREYRQEGPFPYRDSGSAADYGAATDDDTRRDPSLESFPYSSPPGYRQDHR